MKITAYDDAGGVICAWPAPAAVELAYGLMGPDQASVAVPRGSSCLARDKLMPGNVGCFLEIDARLEGSPWPFVGRVATLEQGSRAAERRVGVMGPRSWLELESVPGSRLVTGSAARIVGGVLDSHPSNLWLRAPESEQDDGGPLVLEAQTIWGLLEELQTARGLECRVLPIPNAAPWHEVRWFSPLSARDRTDLRLEEGVNCEWDGAFSLNTAVADLVGLGRAFMSGGSLQAIRARAPSRVLGRRAALTAVVSPVLLEELLGGAGAIPVMAAGTRDMIEATVTNLLRRNLSPVVAATIEITDLARLWGELVPGDLVSVHLPSDDTGILVDAIARVRTLTISPIAPQSMQLSVELWEA